jgi:tetratricopeptide (TPR) repeat protein
VARLEDYELGRVLASGGMGVVHEAVERATGRQVALKRILPGALESDATARFVLEGRAVARLSHPGIVRVHALDESPSGPFMVMDLVAGESLQRVLDREGPLAPARALELARELAGALAHAHERGVLHRDLKPANVLLDEAGAAKLIDFGLAKLLGATGSLAHLTRTGELVGTPSFMAPEQATGGATDARTDVYGLGATLFALLTGRPPFAGVSAIAVMYAVTSSAPPPPSRLRPGLSPALDRVVLDCLAKEPAARPPSMAALLARLEGLELEGGGARSSLVAAGFIVVALAAAFVAGLVRDAPSPAPLSSTAGPTSAVVLPPRPVPVRVDTAAAFLERAHARARQGDVEAALRAPPEDAPAEVWLAYAYALLSAGRATDAARALKSSVLDDAAPEVVLARFRAAAASDRASADPRALDALLGKDRRWAEGLFERALHEARTAPDRARLRAAVHALEELGAHTLAGRLRCVGAAATNDVGEIEVLVGAFELPPAAEGSPRHAALLRVEHAELCVRSMGHAQAEESLTRALELDPLLARAHYLRGGARRTLKKFQASAADFRRCGELLGPTGDGKSAVFEGIRALLEGGHAADALAALDDVREQGLSADSERLLGDALRALGRPDEAIAAYERVLNDLLPGDWTEYSGAASGLAELGRERPDWTSSYLELLRRDAPTDPAPWLWFSRTMLEFPEAAEVAATAAIDRGGGVEAHRTRAEHRTALGQHSGALADWNEVVRAAPDDGWARYQRGRVCWTLGARERALEDLDRAVHLLAAGNRVRLATVHLERSTMRDRLGDLQGAIEDAREAQRLVPGRVDPELVRRLEARASEAR